MEKLKLKLCAGTMCYVMGGAQLMGIVDSLSEEEKGQIDITFSPCLQRCDNQSTPPFVELNGRILEGISKEKLIQIIKEELKHAVR